MSMCDRFRTEDEKTISDAIKALRDDTEFRATVLRPQCDPAHREQHWRGKVGRITRMGDGFEIEVWRDDVQ